MKKGNYWKYEKAKQYVRKQSLESTADWKVYCKSGKKPTEIPNAPHYAYKDEWENWGEWLGTGRIATHKMKYLPFEKARRFVRSLGLKSQTEWQKYANSKTGLKPDNIPYKPERTYKDHWKGMGDWLGTGILAPKDRTYRSFDETRSFVRNLQFKSGADWKTYCKSQQKPADIPNAPWQVYEKWTNWGDFLGTGTVAPWLREYLPFEAARDVARSLELGSGDEWDAWHKSCKPKDIPASPNQVYDEWIDWYDWLGKVSPISTKERFIEEAAKIHGDWYNYDKVVYISAQTPVIIICPTHGEFSQRPDVHIRGNGKGSGCVRCSGRVPCNYWKDVDNHRAFLEQIAIEQNITYQDGWYSLYSRDFPQKLLSQYGNSHKQLLSHHFPHWQWHEWKFVRTRKDYWRSEQSRREYLDWLGSELGYSTMEDWYNITGDIIRNNYGDGLLASYYNGAYQKMVMELYPEFDWCEWRFATVPDGFWLDTRNQVRYLDWLEKELGFRTVEDWYGLSMGLLVENCGYGMYHLFGSVTKILKTHFPEHDWKEWLFPQCSPYFWDSKENRSRYMNWLGEKLGYVEIDDWYKVSGDDIRLNCGGGLLGSYGGSANAIVKDVFDDMDWLDWKFAVSSQGFWHSKDNQRRYMDWLGKQLGYANFEDWYKVKAQDFYNHHGCTLLGMYDASPSKLLVAVYPEHKWNISDFEIVPNGYWFVPTNRKQFMDELFVKLGYKELDDWYKSSQKDFADNGGHGLLRHCGSSHIQAIMETYPEHDWIEWKFKIVPQGFWQCKDNQRRYMDWLGKQLGYTDFEDWYNISTNDFVQNYGGGILAVSFNSSPIQAVKTHLPNYSWLEWKFKNGVPQSFWQMKSNRDRYMKWLADLLGYTKTEDWYSVTAKIFEENHGVGFLDYMGGVVKSVVDYLPNHNWNPSTFAKNRRNQKRIYNILKELHPDTEWEHPHPSLIYNHSGKKMQVDIWIPSLNLVVEYHGEQHYFPVRQWGGIPALKQTQSRDQEKQIKCQKAGIGLLEIPYTWDGRKDTLLELVESKLGVAC